MGIPSDPTITSGDSILLDTGGSIATISTATQYLASAAHVLGDLDDNKTWAQIDANGLNFVSAGGGPATGINLDPVAGLRVHTGDGSTYGAASGSTFSAYTLTTQQAQLSGTGVLLTGTPSVQWYNGVFGSTLVLKLEKSADGVLKISDPSAGATEFTTIASLSTATEIGCGGVGGTSDSLRFFGNGDNKTLAQIDANGLNFDFAGSGPDAGIAASAAGVLTPTDGAGGDGSITIGAAGTLTINGGALSLETGTNFVVKDDVPVKYGTTGDILTSGELTTLTDGVATTVFSVVMADGDMAGLHIVYTIQSTDGSDAQAESGTVLISVVDLAGGVTASTPGEVSVQALSAGTLTSTWTVDTTDDGSIEIQLNADTSLTPSTHVIRWKATYTGDVSLTVP